MRANFIDPDAYTLQHKVNASRYAQHFHIMPRCGLLNDPNGFIEFNGTYHLFYQTHPFAAKHEVKYWFHLVSNDLVHWEEKGFALKPEYWYETDGCCSGSAVVRDGRLYLFYTGKILDSLRRELAEQYQAMAVSDDGEHFAKKPIPLIGPLEGEYSAHFRDPKVWLHDGRYYMIVAAQTKGRVPRIMGYVSEDLTEWTSLGPMQNVEYRLGYMWECPGFARIDGMDVLFICPQGATYINDPYHNLHASGYLAGQLDYESFAFDHMPFQLLDYGFDYYAPYVYSDSRGRHLCVGWLGLPGEIDHPTADEGWLHCLSVMTELTWKDGTLYRYPVAELANLFPQTAVITETGNTAIFHAEIFRLRCVVQANTGGCSDIRLRSNDKKTELLLRLNFDRHTVTLDRSRTNTQNATVRTVTVQPGEWLELDIWVDQSSVELFITKGRYVMSGRIYMDEGCTINTIGNRSLYQSIEVFTP